MYSKASKASSFLQVIFLTVYCMEEDLEKVRDIVGYRTAHGILWPPHVSVPRPGTFMYQVTQTYRKEKVDNMYGVIPTLVKDGYRMHIHYA